MSQDKFKESWLIRETVFSAFTQGSLLDFWQQRIEKQFIGAGGLAVCYVYFCHPAHEKVLVISPGRGESYAKYPEVAYDFYQLGYDIFIIDHRGQGYSERLLNDPQKGHVEQFQDYVDDFEVFVECEIPLSRYKKCFALTHSMGGAIFSGYLLRNQAMFSAAVLLAPMMGINLPLPRWLTNFIVNSAETYLPARHDYAVSTGKWQPLPYLMNLLTHSQERYRRYLGYYADYPELRIGGPTYHWIRESLVFSDTLILRADEIKLPLLVFAASEEKIVDNDRIGEFCRAYMQSKATKPKLPLVLQGAYHEILFETDALRAMALNAISDFFDRH